MGAGIGLGFAQHGASVTYLTRRPLGRRVKRSREVIGWVLWTSSRSGSWTRSFSSKGFAFCPAIDDLPASELVIESIPEDLWTLKIPLLAQLSKAQPDALLCSNTSSLSITVARRPG